MIMATPSAAALLAKTPNSSCSRFRLPMQRLQLGVTMPQAISAASHVRALFRLHQQAQSHPLQLLSGLRLLGRQPAQMQELAHQPRS